MWSLFQIVTQEEEEELLLHPHRQTYLPCFCRSRRGCIPTGNANYCLQLFTKLQVLPQVTDITEFLSFGNKSILAGDLKAKHPFWNSAVPNPSGEKLQ
jgi:hypothetical protein